MGYTGEAPESVSGGGGFLDEPGTYHFVVSQGFDDQGKRKKDGSRSPISGCTLELVCLGGTVEGCEGKSHSETLFYPSPNGSEKANDIKKRALAALLIAANQMQPESLGGQMAIDQSVLDAIVERNTQIVMKLGRQMENDGNGNYTVETRFLQLDYANVYHVDDPEVAAVPKDAEALKLIDQQFRHGSDWFGFKQANQQPVAAAAATSFDDIV